MMKKTIRKTVLLGLCAATCLTAGMAFTACGDVVPFEKEEKVALYDKLHTALKNDGYFILTDYFSLSDEEEQMHRRNLMSLKEEQGIADNEFYHYDTPLTVKHETEAIAQAGFSSIEVLNNWGATYTIKAVK